MKYKEVYLQGLKELEDVNIAEAKLDARILLERVCGTNRNTLLAYPDKEVDEAQTQQYRSLIQDRKKRIPLQYIIGEKEFMGLKFVVDENVLIPRQDTEFVVEEAMRYIQDSTSILDMCTGSGCIILSLLHYTNHCTGVAVDISEKALEVAKENAKVLKEERVTFVQSDLFCNVDKAKKFDYIISNPPYIESAVIQTLEPEVKKYEPLLALDGMEDGMHFYRQIIEQAPKYLNRGGMLFLEIGYNQAESVKQLLEEANFIQIQVKKDYAGLERMVFATFLEERNV